MVRIIWCLLALASGGLVLLGLPAVGQRPDGYGALFAAINLAVVAVFVATSALLVWRRPTDRVAVFGAFALLLFGSVTFLISPTRPSSACPRCCCPRRRSTWLAARHLPRSCSCSRMVASSRAGCAGRRRCGSSPRRRGRS